MPASRKARQTDFFANSMETMPAAAAPGGPARRYRPWLVNAHRERRTSEPESPDDIVSENLLLGLLGDIGALREFGDHTGKRMVGMRIVGREADVPVAHPAEHFGNHFLLPVSRHKTLPLEVLRGLELQLHAGVAPFLHMMLHALRAKRHPAAAGFDYYHAEIGMEIQKTAANHAQQRHLLL